MTTLAFSPLRRGACPGLSAPMPTGDGLLARLLPTATIPLDAFRALCAAAHEHGNGIIEITARGSIQVRGLSAASAVRFAEVIAKLNITASDTIQVLSNPLAGLDPEEILHAGEVAAALRHALAKTPLPRHLAPKVSVIVDGGGAPGLGHLVADVRLRAGRSNDQVVFHIGVAGDQTTAMALGTVVLDHAVEVALHLLDIIARSGYAARARDLVAADAGDAFRAAIADFLVPGALPPSEQKSSEPIGTYPLRDGAVACGFGLAFGHATAASLEELTGAAPAQGAAGLRAAPGRVLLIIGLDQQAATSLTATAERLGFVVRADDPRRYVFACAGAPICSSAHIAARTIAPRIAEIAASQLGPDFDIHISGCAKGCAHSKQTALTIVGTANGCAMIAGGRPGDVPFATVPTDELPEAIARFADASRRDGCREHSQETSQDTNQDTNQDSSQNSSQDSSQIPAKIPAKIPAMSEQAAYLRDGTAIYERSFAIIRAEADLSRFTAEEADIAVRMIHACGAVEAAQHIVFGPNLVAAARGALAAGAPIFCDAEMVAHGVTRARLPARNEVICTLNDPRVADLASTLQTTRSAAALDLWRGRLAGAVVAIGNAPTALFRLLELLDAGAPKPAAILGIPVGFVGAAEAKEALAADSRGVPFLIVRGRIGGSAMTAAAINALARAGL